MKRLLYVLAFVLASLQTFGQNADEQPVEDMIAPGYSSWVYRSGYIHRRDGNRLLAVDELGQADWEYIWFMFSGEYFYIEEFDRVFISEDTGPGVQGKHLDLFYEDYDSVLSFPTGYYEVFSVEYEEVEVRLDK